MSNIHRVAVVQAGSTLFDTPRTLERMEAHCQSVARSGATLAVFPEAYIGGYPKGLTFGARVGSRSPEGRDEFLRYHQAAVDVPGPECRRMGELAKATKADIVVGVVERSRGTLYCTVLFFSANGELVGKHRKLMPTGSERLVWGQGDGSTLTVVETPAGKVGSAICWENYMPNLRQAMYAKGVEIWCAPTVDEREIWQCSMRHIAYEGRVFVLSACQYTTEDDLPPEYRDAVVPQLIRGGSVIIGPLGNVMAGPLYDQEAILTADIDLEDIARGKFDLDVSGHYARADVFQLLVDERSQTSTLSKSGDKVEAP